MATLSVPEISKERVIYDCNHKPYSVIMVNSSEELKNLPEGLFLDRRISQHADWQNGLCPDLDHSRFQVFLVKDKTEVIGLTTLLYVPYKNLFKQGYLKAENNVVTLTPITEILAIKNPNTFMLECGFTQLLESYRAKQLGVAILKEVIAPTASDFITRLHGDIFVICSAQGIGSQHLFSRIQNLWNKYLEGASDRQISIPVEDLGKIAPQARFTEKAAKSFGLKQLENTYHFRLGPVFVRRL